MGASLPRESSLPPGPRAPALWQTLRYLMRPLPLFEECGRRYGDMFTLRLVGSGTWVFVASPALARRLFTAPPEILETGAVNHSVWGALAGRNTVFTLDRADHVSRRRLLLPPFHGEHLRSYVDCMREVTGRVVETFPKDRAFPIQPQIQRITLRVLLRAGFGLEEGDGDELLDVLIRVADDALGSRLLLTPQLQHDWGRYSPWGRIVSIIRRMDEVLFAEIARRRRTGERRKDVLSLLLDTRDENGNVLSDTDIRDETVTMLMAGHDTTETELTWAFGLLLSHPDVLEKLRDELKRVLGERSVSHDDLANLPYLEAVIHESMRLRPVAPHLAFRRLTAPFEVGGHLLPAGTLVSNAVHLLQRRADVYENPLEFEPARFLEAKADPYEWAPFGGGSRRCLGMAFALVEMKVVLATVLRRFDLWLADGPPEPVRSGFFLVPKGGLRVRACARA